MGNIFEYAADVTVFFLENYEDAINLINESSGIDFHSMSDKQQSIIISIFAAGIFFGDMRQCRSR